MKNELGTEVMEMEEMSPAQEYNEQGQSLYGLGKDEEAMKMYKKALDEDPACTETYLNMAKLYITKGSLTEARDSLNRLLRIDKNSGEAYFHLGNISYLEGKAEEAVADYTTAADSDTFDGRPALYHLALLYIDMGKPKQALFHLNRLLKLDPFHAEGRLRKIELLVTMGRFEEALKNAEKMTELLPDLFEGYHYQFITLLGMERMGEALAVLEHAGELFPKDLGFVYDKIKYFEQTEEYDRAIGLIDDRFRDSLEDYRAIRKEKAKILCAAGRFEEAGTLLREILDEEYDTEMCYLMMHLYEMDGLYEKEMECCRRIQENGGEGQYYFAALFFEAAALDKLGRTDEALAKYRENIPKFRQATGKYRGNFILWLYRILCYRRVGEYDRALELSDYLITLTDRQMGEAFFVKGMLYGDLCDKVKEKEFKDRGLMLSPVLNGAIGAVMTG